jgi:hypothetical protein
MREMWTLAVFSEMKSDSPISRFVWPSGDVGEERDRCDGAQFHGARLSVRDRGICVADRV